MLGYPESRPELISPEIVLYRREDWGMGNDRSFDTYMKMVGIDTHTKQVSKNNWCHVGEWPNEAKQYMLPSGKGKRLENVIQ